MWRWTRHSLIITVLLCLLSILPVQAQQNLLRNPGFEDNYSGRGRGDFNFPEFWEGWWNDSPRTEAWMNVAPTGYPHTGPFRRSGTNAQSIAKGGGTFTAAAIQRVQNVPAGAILRGSAWVFIENSNGTNAQVRIGLGSNVGDNPYGAVTWSGWQSTLNSQQQISVEHVATGGEVTIFIFATQTWPNDPNAVYIDDAELIIVGEGEAPAADSSGDGGGNTQAAVPTVPRPGGVAFVVPQGETDDGGITHIVSSGDTLASIAVAYGVRVSEIQALNGLSSAILQVGQELIITKPEPREPEETAEVADEPAATEEVNGAGAIVTDLPTATPSITPTETPAESPTPSDTPTETPIPDTATPAPTAPVAEADTQNVDLTQLEPGICIGMFNDENQDGVKGAGEGYLADGTITLNDGEGAAVETYVTDGESEPFCIEDLAAGQYTLNGTEPEGFGMTTSPVLRVNLDDGESVTVRFGAKEGLEVLAMPTVDINATVAPPEAGAISDDQNDLSQFSGLLVFGLAAAVLIIGFGASLLMRGR